MKNIFYTLLFLTTSLLHAQTLPLVPYEPLQLISGTEPIWYETAFHPAMVNEYCDGRNKFFNANFRPIIKDNFIYSIYDIVPKSDYGIYLEKRHALTGQLIWQQKYDRSDLDRDELFESMYINDADQLVVLSIRQVKPYTPGSGLQEKFDRDCRLMHRTFDITTGELLEAVTPSADDSVAVVLPGNSFYVYLFNTDVSGEYQYLQDASPGVPNSTNQRMIKVRINKYGQKISNVDTIDFGTNQRFINMRQISIDSIVFLRIDSTNTKMYLRIYDGSFNLIKEVPMDTYPGRINDVWLESVHKDYFIVYDWDTSIGFFYKPTYLVYDYEGRLLDYIIVPKPYTDTTSKPAYLKKYKKLAMLCTIDYRNTGLKPLIHYYESDGQGGLTNKSEWLLGDSLRAAVPNYIGSIGEDKILFRFGEIRSNPDHPKLDFDRQARAKSMMLFNLSETGIASSTSEINRFNGADYGVYPNPARDEITIQMAEGAMFFGKVTVTDITGRQVHFQYETNASTIAVDISSLQPGMYQLSLTDGKGKIGYKTKKIIKVE